MPQIHTSMNVLQLGTGQGGETQIGVLLAHILRLQTIPLVNYQEKPTRHTIHSH